MKFTFVSRFAVKFIEVAGAGLASALCAYVLGQIERPPAPATTVVQISPATIEKTVGAARVTAVALGGSATQPERTPVVPTVSSAPKPAKSTSVPVARRTPTSEQGASAEPKTRSGQPLPIQPLAVASNSAPSRTTTQTVQPPVGRDEAAAWNSDEERPLLARLKQIPSWFLPENDRVFSDLPRPPMPVGESLGSAM
jgi:hypothetical protein